MPVESGADSLMEHLFSFFLPGDKIKLENQTGY